MGWIEKYKPRYHFDMRIGMAEGVKDCITVGEKPDWILKVQLCAER